MGSKLGRPVSNKHKVPQRTWKKWSNEAKRVFNAMMQEMRPQMQWVFLHPDASPAMRQHWETTRWNAAWVAAYAVDRDYTKKVIPSPVDKRIRKLTRQVNKRVLRAATKDVRAHFGV